MTLLDVPTIRVRMTPQPVSSQILATTGGYRLWVGGRKVSESAEPISRLTVRRNGSVWQFNSFTASGGDAVIEPAGGLIRCGASSYRGKIRLAPAGRDGFIVVNHVDMESYLAGVLGKELYPYWSIETYRALAVAARTFALYHMKTSKAGDNFDVGDDQGSQVYGGFSAESEKSWQAVKDTHGMVLCHGPAGGEQLFLAQYSACCGGWVNPALVIRDSPDIPPVHGGQKCDDCRRSPRYRWPTVRIAKADLYRALAQSYPAVGNLGGIATVRVVSQTSYGRPAWIDVVGPTGKSIRLRAEDLRLVVVRAPLPEGKGLYSMNCRILDTGTTVEFADGRGFGHGVGLCQWGAQGKAEGGWRWDEILGFYYPQAQRIYAY
jgi:stage II sporulation protein D